MANLINEVSQIIFPQLPGNWSFLRNFSTGDHVVGKACFKETAPNLLHYQEQGVLIHQGGQFTVYRDYFYSFDRLSNEINVYFARNQQPDDLLHTLFFQEAINPIIAAGRHLCKNDCYEVSYHFLSEYRFEVIYRVKGPRKDYVSTTQYSKTVSSPGF